MEINDIWLDALGGLFCAPIHKKKNRVLKRITFDKYANFQVFNIKSRHNDYNESYKIEKEKGIDNLLLSHDKEDVGFKNELGKHKNVKWK